MRYLLITLIAAISIPTAVQANWLGKYGSRYEALEACKSWVKKGKVYFVEYESYLGWEKMESRKLFKNYKKKEYLNK